MPPCLSSAELEAERIYELYAQNRMGERSLLTNFFCLQRRCPEAALYLVWLLKRAAEYEACD